MSVTLYTVARAGEHGRFITIGQLMAAKSFLNRLAQDGVKFDDAAQFQQDIALSAFRNADAITHGAIDSDCFTRELNGTRYRVIGTCVKAPEIPQD